MNDDEKMDRGGAPLALMISTIYVGSPCYAVYSLGNTALEAGTDKLDASVDFPAVRESVKSPFSAAMMTEILNDPRMKDNPFAGQGAMMLPALIDLLVDAFITPDGVTALIRGQKPIDVEGKIAPELQPNPDIESRTEYVRLDRFCVRLHNSKFDEDGPSMGGGAQPLWQAGWKGCPGTPFFAASSALR